MDRKKQIAALTDDEGERLLLAQAYERLTRAEQRGIPAEEAVGLIVNGYAKEVMNKLPMEFAVEAQKLLQINLEGSVG